MVSATSSRGAHFKRERKVGGKFRHPDADGVDAENDMVVGARDNANEAVVVLEKPPALGGINHPPRP
jgi:hypothetical protein